MKTYVLPDVHGCAEPMLECLEKVNFDYENDKLIFLGDVCDRGSDTWQCMEILLKIKNLVFIRGNHDERLIDWLDIRAIGWFKNGWDATLKSYNEHKYENEEAHKKLLNSSVYYHIEDNMLFTHGGIDTYLSISEQDPKNFAWNRDMISNVMNSNGDIYIKDGFDRIFIGHTPTICWNVGDENNNELKIILSVDNPITYPIIKNKITLLDTGCGKGGLLTIYDLNNNTWIQSSKKY